MVRHAFRRVLGQRSLRGCNRPALENYARQLEKRLDALGVDAVFSPSSWLVAYVRTKLPVYFWTDACFAGMVDFYESFSELAPRNVRDGHDAERSALKHCAGAFYASDWAARLAVQYYQTDPAKVRVVPFGANILDRPTPEEIALSIAQRNPHHCELVLVGVDWKRKGVDRAVRAVESLVARNRSARLTVVGCSPPHWTKLPDCVRIIPFVSKNTVEGRRLLGEIYARSHFLIMPSRAEAYGLVFAEANSFGLPCLGTAVGGIPSIITNGVNGQLFPVEAEGGAYADYIIGLMDDFPRYKKLATLSAETARTRFNWDIAGRQIATIMEDACPPPRKLPHRADQYVQFPA
jgi:glycosyltransferase involved in cell wall biosynthesis